MGKLGDEARRQPELRAMEEMKQVHIGNVPLAEVNRWKKAGLAHSPPLKMATWLRHTANQAADEVLCPPATEASHG